MAIDTVALEQAIRNAIPVSNLEIEDQSNGCGENYAVLIVSEVCFKPQPTNDFHDETHILPLF